MGRQTRRWWPLSLKTESVAASANEAICSVLAYSPELQPIPILQPEHLIGPSVLGLGAFARQAVPWKEIADWTHRIGEGNKSATDIFLDANKQFGSYHRINNHHPWDFLKAYFTESGQKLGLSSLDYGKHMLLDVITTRGVPFLPLSLHNWLEGIGLTTSQIAQLSHFNAFDLTFGSLSLANGTTQLYLAITGHLEWSESTFVVTFGSGISDSVAGILNPNPLLVTGGLLKTSAGVCSLVNHLMIPEPAPIDLLIGAMEKGAFSGCLVGAVRAIVAMSNGKHTQAIRNFGESLSIGMLLSVLGSGAVGAVPVAGSTIAAARLALSMADLANLSDSRTYLSSSRHLASVADRLLSQMKCGSDIEAVNSILRRHVGEADAQIADWLLSEHINCLR